MITPVTQQNKSLSLREIVSRLQMGLPISVNQHQTFDLEHDADFDSQVVDEFSDRLEIQDYHIQLTEQVNNKLSDYKPPKQEPPKQEPLKTNNNETQKNETSQN